MLTDKVFQWLMRDVPNFGINSLGEIPIALGSDIGSLRKENQDRLATLRVNANSSTSPPFIAVAIADGMGGMLDGAECASRTLAVFFNALIRYRQKPPNERLFLATTAANEIVYQYAKAKGGATLSAVLFDSDNRAFTVNVGDSRIYATKFRADEVFRLTVDDSLEEVVGGHGRELLQFIGMGQGLVPHISPVPEGTEKIVITSDGVHFISNALLSDILINTNNKNEMVEQLLTVAKWRGGPDNASVAVALVEDFQKSLNLHHESGVEVSDPFGMLQVMWIRQEAMDAKEQPAMSAVQSKSSFTSSKKTARPQNLAEGIPYKKPPKTKSNKVGKKINERKSDNDPQIEILIESDFDTHTTDDVNSDNS